MIQATRFESVPASRRTLMIIALLATLGLFAHGRSTRFGFVAFDDPEYVRDNSHVRAGLTIDNLGWAMTSTYFANWHPLTWISLMTDAGMSQVDPRGFHLTNVLLHVINVLLLFGVLRSMTGQEWSSALASALFAVHPLRVESVAWISERKDLLCTLFWLFTMWAYVGYSRRGGAIRYSLVLVVMALGLMAKSMLVTLPLALLLLDYWPLGRGISWPVIMEKVPMLILAAGTSVITVTAQRGMDAFADLSLGARLANALVSYARYLAKYFWPFDLALAYPHPSMHDGPGWPPGVVASAMMLIVGITVMVWLLRRDRPWLIVGWWWFMGTMVPVIGLVQVGFQAMADRYAYIPMIGIEVAIAWTLADACARRASWREPVAIVMSLIIALLAVRAWHQTGYWHDSHALFEHSLAVMPDNWQVHEHYAGVLERQGDRRGAVQHLEEAIRLHPQSAAMNNTVGAILYVLGEYDRARAHFDRALELKSDFADPHNNLAILDQKQGRTDSAEAHLRAALKIKPDQARTRKNLGLLLGLKGEYPEAMAEIEQAIRQGGKDADEYRQALEQVKAMMMRAVPASSPSTASSPPSSILH